MSGELALAKPSLAHIHAQRTAAPSPQRNTCSPGLPVPGGGRHCFLWRGSPTCGRGSAGRACRWG